MNYRFLTEQEFRDISKWSESYGVPCNWNDTMLKYLGQPVPEEYWDYCSRKVSFTIQDREEKKIWHINKYEYTHLPLPKSTPELKFKVGDKVHISSYSSYKPQGMSGSRYLLGTVVRANSRSPEYVYSVKWENNESNTYREEDLVAPTVSPYKFKVGDFVKVVKNGSGFAPDAIGAITQITKLTFYGDEPGYEVSWPTINGEDLESFRFNGLDEAHGESAFELASAQSKPSHSDLLESNLAKAIRLYPVGTVFTPAHVTQPSNYCILTDDSILEDIGGDIIATVYGNNWIKGEKYGNTSLNRVIYCGTMGNWAEIITPTPITTPEEKEDPHAPGNFQVGDYIVSLKTYTGHRDKGEVFTAKRITGEYVEYNLGHPTGLKDTFRRAYIHEIPRYSGDTSRYDTLSPKKQDIPLIEPVHSVKNQLRTKKTKFKF